MNKQSVLEKEAAVQREPLNSTAWFELGVKQQENEREDKAIMALTRAVELDPSYSEAWLALAISQTNENNRSDAYDAIQNWIEKNDQYKAAVLAQPFDTTLTTPERHRDLVNRLLGMARMVPEGEVDADIQIALAVLLNTSEVSSAFL